ncbi:sensor histidine kinase [Clostridium intestinale]|uniref:histidine kinase n=1 Tax=Clostridium intestinale DSM 6191 TaxID=1121320 RepID=A0A1M5XUJ8_9CLOT|nr:ATP-binding protein [Clostridium intestinale]SHI03491.1 Signal transduction histidine kinase [Clostridium intestinale DSM 6191]
MQSIRRRLSILFVVCSIIAILFIILFVNLTINNKFNKYMQDIQDKRYERIVDYMQEVYKKDGKWSENSGKELAHEAYMGSYCITLYDKNKDVVWGMDPKDIKFNSMMMESNGVYSTKKFDIVVDNQIVGYVDIGQYSSVLLTEEDINFKSSINKSIILSGVSAMILIIGISMYFSKQFTSPIKEVIDRSVNLSNGEFEGTSNMKTNIKELEELKSSIDVLAQKLSNQDKLRKQLISDMSHEIRTPLNVLQNNLEAMIDGVFPVTDERLSYLNEEVIRFGKLLNNLDTLKEFESESIRYNFEIINLEELLDDLCKDYYMISKRKNIQLSYFVESKNDFSISADVDKLKQVFINLISNAIKFTKEKGNISIILYSENNKSIVEIKDDGVGINKEDLPFIFERLYRGDKSRHKTEGNGIGLTVVKNILQMHSAKIEVESEVGEGTTFRIYFEEAIRN